MGLIFHASSPAYCLQGPRPAYPNPNAYGHGYRDIAHAYACATITDPNAHATDTYAHARAAITNAHACAADTYTHPGATDTNPHARTTNAHLHPSSHREGRRATVRGSGAHDCHPCRRVHHGR